MSTAVYYEDDHMNLRIGRKRDAAATRSAILAAAKHQFMDKGFDAAGLRDIAADAGVNVALIGRYFGSKESLFEEAVLPDLNIDMLLIGERATFGERVAATLLKDSGPKAGDPTLNFVRSIGSEAARPLMNDAIERAMIERLAAWLGGDDAKQRAALIVAHLLGFDMLRRMARVSALHTKQKQKIATRFARAIQNYVDDV